MTHFDLLSFFAGMGSTGATVVILVIWSLCKAAKHAEPQIWEGWAKCPGCRGVYARMSSDDPAGGYCCIACKEITEIERLYAEPGGTHARTKAV
jgi:hypothetical protein